MALLNVASPQCPPAFSSVTQLNNGTNVVVGNVRLPSFRKGSHMIRKCVAKGGTVSTPVVVDVDIVKRSEFPTEFIFGAGTSAYQTEGAYKEDGKGLSIWDTFTHQHPEKTNGGANGDIAVDSYHRYKEDIKLLKNMGVDSYRFSIAWTRILPKGNLSGGINQAGIDHYNDLINELLKNGIEPFVTLFHFDTPQALEDEYGGFLSRNIVNDFKDYCDICFKNFGDRVKHWTTVNEPLVYSEYGYDVGSIAPGRCSPSSGCLAGDSATEPYIVSHNLILAHAAAARLYKEYYKPTQGGVIGIALVGQWFLPYSNSHEDRKAADRMKDFLMGWYLGPLVYGEYPSTMRALVKDRLPTFTNEEKEMVQGSADFIGINYYTARYAKGLPITNATPISYTKDSFVDLLTENYKGVPIGPKADESTIYIYPDGLKYLLVYIKEKYQNPTLYVTENGVSRSREHSLTLQVGQDDPFRIEYIVQHLKRIQEAMMEGVIVKGYFVWSLLDSFEFIDGYSDRFGLNFTDYNDNLKRYPKESAKWFRNFLHKDY